MPFARSAFARLPNSCSKNSRRQTRRGTAAGTAVPLLARMGWVTRTSSGVQLKKTVKYTLAALAGGAIVVGGAVAYQASGIGGTVAKAVGSIGLPAGCQYMEMMEEVVSCSDVELTSILGNPKVLKATGLDLKNVRLGPASSLSEMTNLKALFVSSLVDPESINTVVPTAPALRTLSVSQNDPKNLNVTVDVASLGYFDEAKTAPPQKIDPAFTPTVLMSNMMYELSPKSASKLKQLNVKSTVEGKVVDLSGYKSLEILTITAASGTEVSLPKHLEGADELSVITTDSEVSYSYDASTQDSGQES